MLTSEAGVSVPIIGLTKKSYALWYKEQSPLWQDWLHHIPFGDKQPICLMPNDKGQADTILVYQADEHDFWAWGRLPQHLPQGHYHIEHSECSHESSALGWGIGCYEFHRHENKQQASLPTLAHKEHKELQFIANAVHQVRHWINQPANKLTPLQFAKDATHIANTYGGQCTVITGDELKKGFPAVFTVGQASNNKPCMIHLTWGNPKHPRIGLVGKGVCFDSGGLNLKAASGMRLMKKDMGGAAHVLALANMAMEKSMPVHIDLWIPAVENSVGSRAYRPSDIVNTRKGIRIEVGNTDAEGRLILADALAAAQEQNPDLLIDFATLTGAARIALGPDLPAAFIQNPIVLEKELIAAAKKAYDPLWPLPFHHSYRNLLYSQVADLHSTGDSAYGGAITAALMLQHFVEPKTPWIHIDLMAWNLHNKPGRPIGGEAMGLRAIWQLLQTKFGSPSPQKI